MMLTKDLLNMGFTLSDVKDSDFLEYMNVKRICYKNYVDQYYGGWIEDVQIELNAKTFGEMNGHSCFQKILLNEETVGFLAYNELPDKIGGISIQMIDYARNFGIGSFYLDHILTLAKQRKKPVFLKVFKSNPAQNLYKRYGFIIYDETVSHFLMKFDPIIF